MVVFGHELPSDLVYRLTLTRFLPFKLLDRAADGLPNRDAREILLGEHLNRTLGGFTTRFIAMLRVVFTPLSTPAGIGSRGSGLGGRLADHSLLSRAISAASLCH